MNEIRSVRELVQRRVEEYLEATERLQSITARE
jgi:hypothetical protein